VREWCQALGLRHDTVADIQLAVTEAAANAVRHSGCDEFEIRGWVEGPSLTVCVSDGGRGLREPDPGAGLGIPILRQLAESVDFEATEPGTRVTMRFAVGPAGTGPCSRERGW
jgi:serine/threonine-protein kinase RsbW